MFLDFEDRPSESPLVERVWRSRSAHGGVFTSVAASHWEMVVTRLGGQSVLTVQDSLSFNAWTDSAESP